MMMKTLKYIFSIFPWCWCSSGHQEHVRDVEFVTWWIKVTGPGVSWCYHRVLDVIIEWVLCHQGVVRLTFFWWIVHLLLETVMKIGQLIAWLSSCVWSAGSWSRDNLWLVVSLLKRAPVGETDPLQGPFHPGAWWVVVPSSVVDRPVRQSKDNHGWVVDHQACQAKHHHSEVQLLPQGGTIKLVVRQGCRSDSAICVWLLVPILSGSVLAKQN